MRSATDVWPGGLGSSSGELGFNLMDHHFRCGAEGQLVGLDDKYYFGRRPNGIYIPRYRNLFGDKRGYLRGFGYQGAASREDWSRAVRELGVGAAFKDEMATPGPWKFGATAFGEMLPNHANSVGLDGTKKDKWGLPVLKIDCATGENERLMRKDMIADMAEMLEQAGAKASQDLRHRVLSGHGDPRDGHGAHGARSEDFGAQLAQSGVGCTECLRHRRLLHGLQLPVRIPRSRTWRLTARAVDFAVNELNRRNL